VKKLLFLVFLTSNALSFANEPTFDYILLQSGASLQGQVTKIGKKRFKIRIDNKNHFVDNKDVLGVVFDQQLTEKEKQDLGYLDGKRFAKNQTGNFLFGTVSLITLGFPIAIIYVTSKQAPHSNGITDKNQLIIDDEHYLKGYKRGAKAKSTLKAIKGGLVGSGVLFLIAAYGLSLVP
jgi:hypothetical protein